MDDIEENDQAISNAINDEIDKKECPTIERIPNDVKIIENCEKNPENDNHGQLDGEEFQNASLVSEKEIVSRLMRKSQSTKSSPNTHLLDANKKNKIFVRFAISPVMQPIKNTKLMQSELFCLKNI